jgi:putative ABC transport system permease protein
LVGTISALPGVEDAAPYLMFKLDNLTISGIEVGDLATETNAVASDEVVSGRYLEKNDQNGVMLDRVFAELTKLNIGDQFTAFDRTFTVVGIVDPSLHSKPAGIANIYAPISVVQGVARSYGDINGFLVADINVVLVEISPQGDAQYIDNVKQSVLDTVETYAGMKGAIVGYQCGTTARKVVSITENGVWLTSIVLLIGATLFALKSQFGSVAERTKDIGILKAIGWTDSDIVKQVLFESFVQGLAGGFIGILLGCLIILLLPYLGLLSAQNIVLSVSSSMISIGLIASTAAGLFAGFLPAWHAARLQPAEALRHF